MKKKFSLKDHLFNKDQVEYLADLLCAADGTFQKKEFVTKVMSRLLTLELKERIAWIAQVLEEFLPHDFKKAHKIIIDALPEPLDATKADDDFGSFIFAPLGEYVVQNGLEREHLEYSYATLLELTQRFSMEDAMRSFINTHKKQTLAVLQKWSKHKHYHVRRLVSETTRPLLPWSRRIILEPHEAIPFLTTLHADTTRFVTRSVANHLNDISKKNPELVIKLLKQWKKDGSQDFSELDWITRHSLRTLVKQGNTQALQLLGYSKNPRISVEQFLVQQSSKKIAREGTLTFSFTITAEADVDLMVDYVIDFVKAKGNTRPKVFKIKKIKLKKGESISVMKHHRFLADATTYTLYPGVHTVMLQINGMKYASEDFSVTQ